MSTGLLSIGVSGITAAQLSLLATEHNVVNANTPGYNRQRTVQATNIALNTGAGSFGQGVHVQTVQRMYDKFLSSQVSSAQTQVSSLDTYYSQIKQIDSMLADPNAGLSPALQNFFSGVQALAADPSSISSRQSMISSAQTLVNSFHNLDTRLSELSASVNGRISDAVSAINAYSTQIADINQRIVIAQSGTGQPPNDLLDQRDQLVSELNKLVKVSTTTNSDGGYNVYFGTGQQLVVGSQAVQLTAQPSASDASKYSVGLKTPGGTQELPDSLIQGGELGGLLSFRNTSLDPVSKELGRVGASLALTFNAQHGLGQDLLGNISGDANFVADFFTITDPSILPNPFNTGAGSLSATFVNPPNAPTAPDYSGNFYTDLTTSNYQVQFAAGGAYTITRLSDNQVVGGGVGTGTAVFDGVSLNISAVGANGDKFVIDPLGQISKNIGVDSRIAADPRLVAAAAPMGVTPDIANTGSMVISQGIVGVGYDVTGLPLTLVTTAATLNGVPGTWTAVYSDGTTTTSTGNVSLTNGGARLTKIAFSGMSFDINGTASVGDQFVVGRNTAAVQDGRNALLFAKLQTQNTVAGGTASFQSAYARLVADNGIRTREAKVQLDAQQAVLDQATAAQQSYSGVNLDEEAANMLKFQQAYQASSKLIEIGSKLFDTILALG